MIVAVPAELHELVTGLKRSSVGGDWIVAIEVEELKSIFSSHRQQLARWRYAHRGDGSEIARGVFLSGAAGAQIARAVRRIGYQHIASRRLAEIIEIMPGDRQVVRWVARNEKGTQ